ncbi:MAG: type II toxin-antitoxin system RelE/ParE family toxin [Polyangiaceae bacterium]
MRFRLHPDADAELYAAVYWYQADYPGRGIRFYRAVQTELDRIREAPRSFPYWRRALDVQACVLPRFPYTLFFIAGPSEVTVYAVAHQKRRPGYWRSRLPPKATRTS